MARKRKGVPVHGIVLLDKPTGMSSNQALQRVKHLFNAQKAGHTGALDPLATGLLPLCFGQATKASTYLLGSNKRYTVTIQFGTNTDTGDCDGTTQQQRAVVHSQNQFDQALAMFVGDYLQVPPMYSALKHNGQPLYKLARQGIEIERKARPAHVPFINVLNYSDDSVELDVACSSGYYIRSLAVDLGEELGCGGHVTALRRTEVGALSLASALTLEQFIERSERDELTELLMPSDSVLTMYPALILDEHALFKYKHGIKVEFTDLPSTDTDSETMRRVYDDQNNFIGLGDTTGDLIKSRTQFIIPDLLPELLS